VAHGPTTIALHPSVPQLPGDAPDGHFRFQRDQAAHPPRWAANLGQGVARVVALKHKMTSGPVVEYASPDRKCRFDRENPSCP
jgi:hypothetical protein